MSKILQDSESSKVSKEDGEGTPSYSDADKKTTLEIESIIYKYEKDMDPYERRGAKVFDKKGSLSGAL
ncbi:hypothetical protein P4H71_02255 [Paenibacillus kribbensis]|uniref:hypothetical protein n=1 Tax=Paenibacillus kribbensis TaxID=172713 RepID=UPI002DB9D5E1|nr:hypothetical protein [Paenibacillus kribbensis]MEC0233179.1 hypothetical protein [Paenibacillus kribbensis]